MNARSGRAVDALAHGYFGFGKVDAGIDANRLDHVIHDDGLYGESTFDGGFHRIGQIIFTLG